MAMKVGKDGWLEGVRRVPTPNISKAPLAPDMIVMHYTGSSNAAGSISWLCNPKAEASAHIVIDEKGVVTQLAPFNRRTWHAGVSKWGKRSNINQYAVGIELSNPGLLLKLANGQFREQIGNKIWPAWNVVMAEHPVTKSGLQPWAIYPPAQIEAAIEVARAVAQAYPIKEIVGHEDVAPRRKIDPGPAFPMRSFVSRVLGRG